MRCIRLHAYVRGLAIHAESSDARMMARHQYIELLISQHLRAKVGLLPSTYVALASRVTVVTSYSTGCKTSLQPTKGVTNKASNRSVIEASHLLPHPNQTTPHHKYPQPSPFLRSILQFSKLLFTPIRSAGLSLVELAIAEHALSLEVQVVLPPSSPQPINHDFLNLHFPRNLHAPPGHIPHVHLRILLVEHLPPTTAALQIYGLPQHPPPHPLPRLYPIPTHLHKSPPAQGFQIPTSNRRQGVFRNLRPPYVGHRPTNPNLHLHPLQASPLPPQRPMGAPLVLPRRASLLSPCHQNYPRQPLLLRTTLPQRQILPVPYSESQQQPHLYHILPRPQRPHLLPALAPTNPVLRWPNPRSSSREYGHENHRVAADSV